MKQDETSQLILINKKNRLNEAIFNQLFADLEKNHITVVVVQTGGEDIPHQTAHQQVDFWAFVEKPDILFNLPKKPSKPILLRRMTPAPV